MLRNMSKKMGSALRMLAMLRLIPRRGKIDTAALRTRLAGLGWKVSRRTMQARYRSRHGSAREYRLQGFGFQTYLGRDAFQYPKPEDDLIELVCASTGPPPCTWGRHP